MTTHRSGVVPPSQVKSFVGLIGLGAAAAMAVLALGVGQAEATPQPDPVGVVAPVAPAAEQLVFQPV